MLLYAECESNVLYQLRRNVCCVTMSESMVFLQAQELNYVKSREDAACREQEKIGKELRHRDEERAHLLHKVHHLSGCSNHIQ